MSSSADEIEKRIDNGIKFFRGLTDGQWDSSVVKAYLPKFLELVEEYKIEIKTEIFK